MNDDWSEARTAPRWRSRSARRSGHRHVHRPALPLGVVGQELGQQRGQHRPRAQGVGPDALAGVHDGDLARHRQHRDLRRGVGDLRCRRAEVGDERATLTMLPPPEAGGAGMPWRQQRAMPVTFTSSTRVQVSSLGVVGPSSSPGRCRRCCRARRARRTWRRRRRRRHGRWRRRRRRRPRRRPTHRCR